MNSKQAELMIKDKVIDKFVELKSVEKLIDFLINKDLLKVDIFTIDQVRKEYFNRVKEYAQDEEMTLTQIKYDLAEEFELSFQTIERYIYDKRVEL